MLSNRTYGVEIEVAVGQKGAVAEKLRRAGIACYCEGYNHTTRAYWKIVPDQTVPRGFELVSPPLSGNDGIDQIRTVCKVLNRSGVTITRDCGLHVHHDASDLTVKQWKMLFKQYVKHEGVIDTFMPQSRRANNNSYCRSLRVGDLQPVFDQIDQASDVRSIYQTITRYTRYVKLNIEAFFRRGTVEFRQHSGTTDADKIVAWIMLTQAMIEYSKILKWMNPKGADKFENLMAFRRWFGKEQKDETKFLLAYYRKRIEEVQSES